MVIIIVIVPLIVHGLLTRKLLAVFLARAAHATSIPRIIVHVAQFIIRVGPSVGLGTGILGLITASDESFVPKPLLPNVAFFVTTTVVAPEMLCSPL